jgi:uncharacterized membrane protein YsdA (DUF1294 family)
MPYYILAVSFLTFILWGIDKSRAIKDQWRIPEKWLFALIIIGGALGALLGMVIFRHKTRKTIFWVVAILACLVHAVLLFWLF